MVVWTIVRMFWHCHGNSLLAEMLNIHLTLISIDFVLDLFVLSHALSSLSLDTLWCWQLGVGDVAVAVHQGLAPLNQVYPELGHIYLNNQDIKIN